MEHKGPVQKGLGASGLESPEPKEINQSRVKFLTAVNINSKTFRVVLSLSRYQCFCVTLFQPVGHDSSVSEVTCYMLNAPGIKSQWWRDLLHPSRIPLGHSELPVRWVLGLFPNG